MSPPHAHLSLAPQRPSAPHPASQSQTAPRARHVGNRTRRHLPGGTEAVWTEELHAALLEALATYPPSARSRPARSGGTRGGGGGSKGNETRGPGALGGDGDAHGGRARVGRYQLIREFLRRKTGKVRSLQQIGSRMQHLRRAHAGDAYMMALLRSDLEFRKDGSASAAAADSSSSRRPDTVDAQGLDASTTSSAAYMLPGGPSLGLWTTLPPAGADTLSPSLDPHARPHVSAAPDGGAFGFGFAHPSLVPTWAEPSMSRRRLAANMPALRCQLQLPPASAFAQLLAVHESRLDGSQASSASVSLEHMHSDGQAMPGAAFTDPASPSANGAGAAGVPRAGRRKSFCLNTEECTPPPRVGGAEMPSCLPPSVSMSVSVSRTARPSSSVVLGQSQLTNAQPFAMVRAAPPRDNKVSTQP